MDARLNRVIKELRGMESSGAADSLMNRYPPGSERYGDVFELMRHISWKRPDQVRLARYYLARRPFADSKPYEVFASFMALPRYLNILREVALHNDRDKELFLYHINPILRQLARSDRDRELIGGFLSEICLLKQTTH